MAPIIIKKDNENNRHKERKERMKIDRAKFKTEINSDTPKIKGNEFRGSHRQ